ncbi:WGxxGxxG family protein [Leptolyngbya sp. CCNP1308]|uniref:WGxxGxxG family protein n=1 Tax=Leptolyngbya sp. CCNP1308 TaxID=3110255 RepID=UPI002B1ECC35|nr:WGxxGxxG family protein [Leptolyngbya sp. CCNP1308]MEA5448671.1 WGxxGxxG family protein [Leptolyngbya sp. CCNP1308]
MKNKTLATWLGTGALALSLAVLPSTLPASAQTNTDPITPGNTVTTTNDDYGDDGFDWGWLGLLGLIGLAGLKGRDRNHDTSTSYADRTTATSTNNPRY